MSSFPMKADENGKKPALRPRRRIDRHKKEYIKQLEERSKGGRRAKILEGKQIRDWRPRELMLA